MTRVNLVRVEDLADQHLFAEWRELKMIPSRVKRNLRDGVPMFDIPKEYTLSSGHVRFFYDKFDWLYERHVSLTNELINRNFELSEYISYHHFIDTIPIKLAASFWLPTTKEIKINIDRISERLNQRPDWYRHYGVVQPPEFFINRYNQQLAVDIICCNTV